jgi:hypothetical protein
MSANLKKLLCGMGVAGLIMSGFMTVTAQEQKEPLGRRAGNGFSGKVTNIKGNVITVMDNKGGKRVLEIKATDGLKVGASAICEEDCGRGIKIGEKVITVRKVVQ